MQPRVTRTHAGLGAAHALRTCKAPVQDWISLDHLSWKRGVPHGQLQQQGPCPPRHPSHLRSATRTCYTALRQPAVSPSSQVPLRTHTAPTTVSQVPSDTFPSTPSTRIQRKMSRTNQVPTPADTLPWPYAPPARRLCTRCNPAGGLQPRALPPQPPPLPCRPAPAATITRRAFTACDRPVTYVQPAQPLRALAGAVCQQQTTRLSVQSLRRKRFISIAGNKQSGSDTCYLDRLL